MMVGITDQQTADKKKYAFSSKNTATKEIENWGRDYGSLTDPSMRSAGQLTDNVTEARMLQSRIMEMSRDRYKYITQAEFNKKFFLSGQQKKTKLMPQLLQGIDIEAWLSKKSDRYVPTFTNSSSSNARFAYLDRLEKQGEKCKDFEQEEDNPFAMQERKIPEKNPLPEFYRIRLKEQEEAELAKTTFPTQPILRPMTQKSVGFCKASSAEKKEVKLPEVPQSAKSMPVTRTKTMPLPQPPSENKAHLRRVQSSRTASMRCVEDQRYKTLESSLSGKYTKPEEVNPSHVQSIIDSQDSLHVPSRHSINARPKLQKTILEYLRARGFVV